MIWLMVSCMIDGIMMVILVANFAVKVTKQGSRDSGFCKKRGDTRLVLLQSVLGDKMGARGKTLRQIYAELLGGGDGLLRSSFPEIVGASNPSVNVDPARKLGIRD